jgi:DNA-binding response OmpR family regulator
MQERLSGVNIVVVDDDEDVLDSFAAALEAEGADVETVSDGNAGVRAVNELKPDVVVLDMMLPGRSGFLALEKIKGKEDSPLVIMVTANEGKRHQAYAESLGVDAYLQKPVPLGSLVECVEGLVKGRAEGAPNS